MQVVVAVRGHPAAAAAVPAAAATAAAVRPKQHMGFAVLEALAVTSDCVTEGKQEAGTKLQVNTISCTTW
jgi:hypothetical protein